MDASPCPYVLKHICSYVLMSFCSYVFALAANRNRSSPLRLPREHKNMRIEKRTAVIYKGYKTKKLHLGPFSILQKLYLPSILHLTLIRCNLLTINTLLSVRYYQCYLHATYTTYMLPHGTSMGEQYHGIGKQKSLLLRLIFLRLCGVKPTAYDKTDCMTAGRGV